MLRALTALLVGFGMISTPEGIMALKGTNPYTPMCHMDATNNPLGLQNTPQVILPESLQSRFTEICPWPTSAEGSNAGLDARLHERLDARSYESKVTKKVAKAVEDIIHSASNPPDNSKRGKLVKFGFKLNSKVEDKLETCPNFTEKDYIEGIIEFLLHEGMSGGISWLIPVYKWIELAGNAADVLLQYHQPKDVSSLERLNAILGYSPLVPIPHADPEMAQLSIDVNGEMMLTAIAAPPRLVAEISEIFSQWLFEYKLPPANLKFFVAKLAERYHEKLSNTKNKKIQQMYKEWSKGQYSPNDRKKRGLLHQIIRKDLRKHEDNKQDLEAVAWDFNLILESDAKEYDQFFWTMMEDLETSAERMMQEAKKKNTEGNRAEELSLLRKVKETRSQIVNAIDEYKNNPISRELLTENQVNPTEWLKKMDALTSEYKTSVERLEYRLSNIENKIELERIESELKKYSESLIVDDPWGTDTQALKNLKEKYFIQLEKIEKSSSEYRSKYLPNTEKVEVVSKKLWEEWISTVKDAEILWYKQTSDFVMNQLDILNATPNHPMDEEIAFLRYLKYVAPQLERVEKKHIGRIRRKDWAEFVQRNEAAINRNLDSYREYIKHYTPKMQHHSALADVGRGLSIDNAQFEALMNQGTNQGTNKGTFDTLRGEAGIQIKKVTEDMLKEEMLNKKRPLMIVIEAGTAGYPPHIQAEMTRAYRRGGIDAIRHYYTPEGIREFGCKNGADEC